jgi:GH43 family beta-xylosidase
VDPASWHKKTNGPVFASNNGEYGTGHNGNFLSPDGTQVWNVFHAVTNPQGSW